MSKDSNSKDAKLFGKYHEVVLLLLAFFMTTICGGLLGYYFQNRSWQQQHQVRLLESERLAAEEVFSEVSRLMDTRMYKMRKVFWGIQGEMGKAEMENRWSDYREILDEWNTNLNTNLALLHRYFGRGAREIFENRIHSTFRSLGSELRNLSSVDKEVLDRTQHRLDDLNNVYYEYDVKLLDAIRDGNVGQFLTHEVILEQSN